MPRWVGSDPLRDWHDAINPIKKSSPSLLAIAVGSFQSFGSPASGAALQDVTVVLASIQHRGAGSINAEQFPPVIDRPIRGDQRAGSLIAAHDDFEQVLASGRG